jgi:hypothetical protein
MSSGGQMEVQAAKKRQKNQRLEKKLSNKVLTLSRFFIKFLFWF